eukprot:358080-Chlamydomonas_euryale.AAC.5
MCAPQSNRESSGFGEGDVIARRPRGAPGPAERVERVRPRRAQAQYDVPGREREASHYQSCITCPEAGQDEGPQRARALKRTTASQLDCRYSSAIDPRVEGRWRKSRVCLAVCLEADAPEACCQALFSEGADSRSRIKDEGSQTPPTPTRVGGTNRGIARARRCGRRTSHPVLRWTAPRRD